MAIPAIPAHGASWDAWAAGLDAAARSAAQIPDVASPGTATGAALRAAFVTAVVDSDGGVTLYQNGVEL